MSLAIAAIAAPAVAAIPAPAAALELSRGPLLPGPRLVHGEIAVVHGKSVELLDRCLRLGGSRHLHEGESARTAGEFVENQVDAGDRAHLTEEVLEVLRGGGKG